MYFFLHVLPEVVSAVFSFLVEWFLFQEQPALYGGTLSPLVTAWLYMAMMLAVWLLLSAQGRYDKHRAEPAARRDHLWR